MKIYQKFVFCCFKFDNALYITNQRFNNKMFNNFTTEEDYQCYNIVLQQNDEHGALLIGDFNSATDQQIIKKHQIKTIITAALGMEHLQIPNSVTHIVYPLKDAKSQNISEFFDESYHTIDQKLNEGGVLVHCAAGVSRSATLIIAYLMKKNQMGFKGAISMLRNKRKGVCPNLGFQLQLKQYQKQLVKQRKTKPSALMKKNNSQRLSQKRTSQERMQNHSFFEFEPKISMMHTQKKPITKKFSSKPLGYTKPQNNTFNLSESDLFISGKSAQRPVSQVNNESKEYSSYRKDPMMGTWGPIHHKSKKIQL